MSRVFVSGAFDDARSPKLRFLQEAAKFGELTLLLWPDEAISSIRGSVPKMGLAERLYYFEALRYVDRVEVAPRTLDPDRLQAELGGERVVWAVAAEGRRIERRPGVSQRGEALMVPLAERRAEKFPLPL